MLEYIAANLASLPTAVIVAIDFALFVAGGFLANRFVGHKFELAREPYFAFFALLALAASARLFLSIHAIDAVLGGYLWAIMALQIVLSVATGFVTGITAIARSRDAFGSGEYAPLAFIPFANLVLLFRRGRSRASVLSLAISLPVGAAMLVGAVIQGVALFQQMEHQKSRPELQLAEATILIESNRLESSLRHFAAGVRIPLFVNGYNNLVRVEAEGAQLRRTYTDNRNTFTLTADVRSAIKKEICKDPRFFVLLLAGASISEAYVKLDGTAIGSETVSRQTCGI